MPGVQRNWTKTQRIGASFRQSGGRIGRHERHAKGGVYPPRQSPEGCRVTLVRSGPTEPLPLAAAFRQAERLCRGDRGGEKNCVHCGTGFGAFKIKGLVARVYFAFTRSFSPNPPLHPPVRPQPRWCGSSGAGKEPGNGARDIRDRLGTARALEPRKSRPGPRNRLQAITLVLPSAT